MKTTASTKIMMMTSIPSSISRPMQGIEFGSIWQAACINSWTAEGFHVVSLNAKHEVAALKPYASKIDVIELPDGRERPLITDFFDAVADSPCELAGIINADCLLLPGIKLREHLAGKVNGLVMAERLNICQTTMLPTGQHCFGFDAFFFKTAAIAVVKRDDSWRIGDTWWDYWFPLSLHLAGVKLKTLPAPILAHLDHDRAWSEQSWKENGQRLNKFLRARTRGFRHRKLAAFVKEPLETEADIPKLGFNIFHWLRSHEPLWYPEAGSMDDLLTRFFLSLSMPPPETIQCPVPVEPTPSSRLRNALGFFKRSK